MDNLTDALTNYFINANYIPIWEKFGFCVVMLQFLLAEAYLACNMFTYSNRMFRRGACTVLHSSSYPIPTKWCIYTLLFCSVQKSVGSLLQYEWCFKVSSLEPVIAGSNLSHWSASICILRVFYCRIIGLSETYTGLIQMVSGVGVFEAFSHITDSIQKVCN